MGHTMDKANNAGREVARERRYNRVDASPGKNTWAMDEKQNTERPNPVTTRPIVVACYHFIHSLASQYKMACKMPLTADSGKFLAVVLMPEFRPAFAPKPIDNARTTSMANSTDESDVAVPIPSSYICFVPVYVVKTHKRHPSAGFEGHEHLLYVPRQVQRGKSQL